MCHVIQFPLAWPVAHEATINSTSSQWNMRTATSHTLTVRMLSLRTSAVSAMDIPDDDIAATRRDIIPESQEFGYTNAGVRAAKAEERARRAVRHGASGNTGLCVNRKPGRSGSPDSSPRRMSAIIQGASILGAFFISI